MEKTIIRAPQGDAMEFVLSDESVDRYGDVIKADGWDLRNFKQNPIALFNHNPNFPIGKWTNVRVEKGRLLARLELMDAVSERLREIQAAVQAGILRAVSVGFRALDRVPRKNGEGLEYTRQELMETSLVSIPANPNALAVAKSLHLSDEAIATVFGEQASEAREMLRRTTQGEQARSHATSQDRKRKPMSLSQRIQDCEAQITAARDKLTDHVNKTADGVMDDESITVTDELNEQIRGLEAARDSLKRAEATLALRGVESPAPAGGVSNPAVVRRPLHIGKKETDPADYVVRAAVVNALAFVNRTSPDAILAQRYPEDEQTAIVAKAAVAGATTTTTGWAAELVNTSTAAWLETLRSRSVYPSLAGAGTRLTFNNQNGAIRIPSRAATPSIGGSFVGEGAPIPVRRLGLSAITLTPKKMGVISVFSREIAMYSTPQIEGLLRQEIEADTSTTLDSLLLDAVAGSSVRPAGLLNGVTPLTATAGGGATAILGDIAKLAAPFDTALAGRSLVLLMNPAQARTMAMTPGPDGSFGWAGQFMGEFQVVTSTNVPAGTLIMIDAADLVTATGDTPQFDVSEETVLHLEDTSPAQIGTVGTPTVVAAPTQSMFQTAQIALRMLLDVTWAMRRAGMVQTISGTSW